MILMYFALTFRPDAVFAPATDHVPYKDTGGQLANLLGWVTYITVIIFLISTTYQVRFVEKKSWDNVSVRCACLFLKAAMLLCGDTGPLCYFCMLL